MNTCEYIFGVFPGSLWSTLSSHGPGAFPVARMTYTAPPHQTIVVKSPSRGQYDGNDMLGNGYHDHKAHACM